MNTMVSLDMNLPIPVVGVDLGPDWANNINSCLTIISSHNHTSGQGIQIPSGGININADLPFNSSNATLLRSVRFNPQVSAISGPTDLGCLYEVGADLYYNDGAGNQVRITQSGSVTGSTGTITGLPSGTASASFGAGTFVFQASTNTPANMDGGSFIFRNNSALSKGLTLSPPSAMGSNYALTLPTIPAQTNIMSLDTSGNMAAVINVDGSTIQLVTNTLSVPIGGITATQIADSVFSLIFPSGTIAPYGGTSAPTGFLLCDGTSYLRATYPNLFSVISTSYGSADSTHFNVPDFRGQFLRGVSGTSTNDPDKASRTVMNTGGNTGNNIGSIQSYQIQSHTHPVQTNDQSTGATSGAAFSTGNTSANGIATSTGGNETRPINAYVNYIIKI